MLKCFYNTTIAPTRAATSAPPAAICFAGGAAPLADVVAAAAVAEVTVVTAELAAEAADEAMLVTTEAAVAPVAGATSATRRPYEVLMIVLLPEVVVKTLVAVVLAVHPAQLVHGAFVPQGPLVQPDHEGLGQAPLEPHQFVHGPVVHAPEDAKGPHPAPPKGAP